MNQAMSAHEEIMEHHFLKYSAFAKTSYFINTFSLKFGGEYL